MHVGARRQGCTPQTLEMARTRSDTAASRTNTPLWQPARTSTAHSTCSPQRASSAPRLPNSSLKKGLEARYVEKKPIRCTRPVPKKGNQYTQLLNTSSEGHMTGKYHRHSHPPSRLTCAGLRISRRLTHKWTGSLQHPSQGRHAAGTGQRRKELSTKIQGPVSRYLHCFFSRARLLETVPQPIGLHFELYLARYLFLL